MNILKLHIKKFRELLKRTRREYGKSKMIKTEILVLIRNSMIKVLLTLKCKSPKIITLLTICNYLERRIANLWFKILQTLIMKIIFLFLEVLVLLILGREEEPFGRSHSNKKNMIGRCLIISMVIMKKNHS